MIRDNVSSTGAPGAVISAAARSLALAVAAALLVAVAGPAFAFAPTEPDTSIERPVQTYSPYVMAYDKLDVEDRQGYNSEYIFGMTKGIMKSTLVPALKPFFAIFTIPLDLAFLPFAAIIGFF